MTTYFPLPSGRLAPIVAGDQHELSFTADEIANLERIAVIAGWPIIDCCKRTRGVLPELQTLQISA